MNELIENLTPWLAFLGPILVALILSIPGFLSLKRQLEKDRSEAKENRATASQKIQEAALSLLDPYVEQVKVLTQKVETLEGQIKYHNMERGKLQKRIKHLEGGVAILVIQLQALGITPDWLPNGEDMEE